jgi:glycosyltransferase involved in cell wall biosynthesis
VDDLGLEEVLKRLKFWRPDVMFVNCPSQPALEDALLDAAPAVLLAHNYHGTCISGSKATRWPRAEPCSRKFGTPCLVQYFPRRCGGLNPLTMWRLYRNQSARLALLPRYRLVLTLSEHMRQEYIKHGVPPERVRKLPPLGFAELPRPGDPASNREAGAPWRLLYLGRMEFLKGVHLLIEALPEAARKLNRPLELDLAGDGPERAALERQSARVIAEVPQVQIRFHGWIGQDRREKLLSEVDLLVVPSIWPEPFGLVGLEAARHGVPAVAFDVGGIRDWLHDGVTGVLAEARPPNSSSLARAMVQCLGEPQRYSRMRCKAREIATQASVTTHVKELDEALQEAMSG